jgi:hypothetical protein
MMKRHKFADQIRGATTRGTTIHATPVCLLPEAAQRLLARAGLQAPGLGATIPVNVLDKAIKEWTVAERLHAKELLRNCRVIER